MKGGMDMKEYRWIVMAENGMHARPAGTLASSLKSLSSEVRVRCGDKEVDGKRLLSLMGLGATRGSELIFTVIGGDEDAALDVIRRFCREHLDVGV